jgi:UDP-N-acetylmuramyl tripeptide synthase
LAVTIRESKPSAFNGTVQMGLFEHKEKKKLVTPKPLTLHKLFSCDSDSYFSIACHNERVQQQESS